jgi:hypothetical protein
VCLKRTSTGGPRAKSIALGQLALHVATLPRQLTEFLTGDELDFGAAAGTPPTAGSHQELLAAFTSSTEQARSYLATLSDERATGTWRRKTAPFCVPVQSLVSPSGTAAHLPAAARRAVPSVYGPTADENPFADA